MDKEQFQKALAERFDNLQPEVQNAIMSSDYEKNIYSAFIDVAVFINGTKRNDARTLMEPGPRCCCGRQS